VRKFWIIPVTIIAVAVVVLHYVSYTPNILLSPESCDSNKIGERDYSIYRRLLEANYSQQRTTDGATIFIPESTEIDDLSVEGLSAQILESGKNVVLSLDAVANFLRLSTEINLLDRKKFTDLPLVLADRAEVNDVFENKGG